MVTSDWPSDSGPAQLIGQWFETKRPDWLGQATFHDQVPRRREARGLGQERRKVAPPATCFRAPLRAVGGERGSRASPSLDPAISLITCPPLLHLAPGWAPGRWRHGVCSLQPPPAPSPPAQAAHQSSDCRERVPRAAWGVSKRPQRGVSAHSDPASPRLRVGRLGIPANRWTAQRTPQPYVPVCPDGPRRTLWPRPPHGWRRVWTADARAADGNSSGKQPGWGLSLRCHFTAVAPDGHLSPFGCPVFPL